MSKDSSLSLLGKLRHFMWKMMLENDPKFEKRDVVDIKRSNTKYADYGVVNMRGPERFRV